MSYSSSGAVATLSHHSGTTKMPVPSTARRYQTTSGTTSYRTTGNTERSYVSATTSSYSSASRNLQTEYHPRYTPTLRYSASVPTSYSGLSEIHETNRRLVSKDQSDANESSYLSYSRSKTDNNVIAPLERCGLKSESFKLRSDTNRFLKGTNIDLKYSLNRKLTTGTSLDLSRFNSSVKSSKIPDLNLRLQRKDSLTKSENAETSPSAIRSLERKSSSSVTGGSSSPIEIRKSSEVWNKRLSGSYESTIKECFGSDLFRKIDNENQAKLAYRENSEDLSESSIILENIESEEKTLSFAEIRRKFDNNDANDGKVGFDSSTQKSSHSKDLKSSISNGNLIGVQYQFLDRNSKCKKVVDNSVDDADLETVNVDQLDSNNACPSSQTLHRLLLKRNTSYLKSNSNNNPNGTSNNINPAYSNPRKSPDPVPDVSNNIKKRSLPDLKKAVLSPEKKELSPPNAFRLAGRSIPESMQDDESKPDDATAGDAKRETRRNLISSLGLDNKNDGEIHHRKKGEKLATKLEQTLSKQSDSDRSPEGKPKELEKETKVFEVRRIEPFPMSSFEISNKIKESENKERKSSGQITTGAKVSDKSPQKASKGTDKLARTSPLKEVVKPANSKDLETNTSPIACRKESSNSVKTKKNASLKDEKETNNVREREMNKRLLNEDPAELKPSRRGEDKFDGEATAKEAPSLGKTELSKNYNNRTLPGPSAYQTTNSFSSNENLENAGIHGTSPRLTVGYSRSSAIEKGGLNGLRNIGNTCFMNSVIQCLSNTKPLLEYLLNEDYLADINTTISGMKGALIKAFSNVIQELWAPNAEDKIINTINFKDQIQRFAPRFMGYSQQDAQEFLRYLLEGLHEDVNRVTVKPKPITTDIDDTLTDNQKAAEAWKRYLRMDDSKVVDIFVGQLKSTLQCTVCSHCSVTFDPFWDLSLPVPNRNGQLRLSSCLDSFTKEEVLDGDEKPTCSKCKTRRKCTKSFSIQKFPKILVLHLKRFSPTERYRGKLSVTVEFPLTNLDLSPYAANRGQACTYNLYAISNHSGTAYSGHYTAYCKHPYTGNWHEYNDSGVSSLSSRSVVSGEAYVLFYELAAQTSHL